MAASGPPMYGAAGENAFIPADPELPQKAREEQPRIGAYLRKKDFLVEWLGPCVVFLVTTVLYAYTFLMHPVMCILWSVIGLCTCLSLSNVSLVPSSAGPLKPRSSKGINTRMLGILGLPAVILGTLAGLYIYDESAVFPQFYANSRKYSNVVPSQPSGAVRDAGKIVFSTGSYVDTSRGAGFTQESGSRYCVAPITDGADRIQFWAAGIGCCANGQAWSCDDVGDSSAKGGIVIFDNNGFFQSSRFDYYEQARKKAQAEYGVQSVTYPIYVRWVKQSNLDMLSTQYSWQAVAWLAFFTACYLGFSFFCTWSLHGTAPEASKDATV